MDEGVKRMLGIKEVVDVLTCVGILVAVFQLYYYRKSLLLDYERVRKQATIDMYRSICDELCEYNAILYKRYQRNPILYSEIEDDEDFIMTTKNYLNILEWISTGVNTGIYDLDVFDRLYGDITIRMYEQLNSYIQSRRRIKGEQELYQDYELLYNNLKKLHQKRLLNEDAVMKNKVE